jgi:hypothetical protein
MIARDENGRQTLYLLLSDGACHDSPRIPVAVGYWDTPHDATDREPLPSSLDSNPMQPHPEFAEYQKAHLKLVQDHIRETSTAVNFPDDIPLGHTLNFQGAPFGNWHTPKKPLWIPGMDDPEPEPPPADDAKPTNACDCDCNCNPALPDSLTLEITGFTDDPDCCHDEDERHDRDPNDEEDHTP